MDECCSLIFTTYFEKNLVHCIELEKSERCPLLFFYFLSLQGSIQPRPQKKHIIKSDTPLHDKTAANLSQHKPSRFLDASLSANDFLLIFENPFWIPHIIKTLLLFSFFCKVDFTRLSNLTSEVHILLNRVKKMFQYRNISELTTV
jgi:hypothetical protein